MPDPHQIRIDIEAEDDASKVLDEVADEAAKLEKLSPEIEVDADTSDATKKLDTVTDDATALDKLSPEIDVTVDSSTASGNLEEITASAKALDKLAPSIEPKADITTAKGDIDKLTSDAEALDRLEPTVEPVVDTSTAEGDIKDLADDLDTLTKQDQEILLRAKIDDAKGALKELRDDLDKTERKAEDVKDEFGKMGGKIPKGQAIADLTGPLGDVSSKAGELSGQFDGLSDLAEGFAGKIGLSEAATGKLIGAIGGIGLAITAATTLWGIFKQKQDDAKQKQQELIDGHKELLQLLEEGKFTEAADEISKLYKDAFNAASDAQLPIQQVTDYILGLTDVLPDASGELKRLNDMVDDGKLSAEGAEGIYRNLNNTLTTARDRYRENNGSIREQSDRQGALAQALEKSTGRTDDQTDAMKRLRDETDKAKDGFDKLSGALDMEQAFLNFNRDFDEAMTNTQKGAQLSSDEIFGIKEDVLRVAEAAKLTPIQVKTLLEDIDKGDLRHVQAVVTSAWNADPPTVSATFIPPTQADVDRVKADLRARFGSLNVPVEAVPRTRNGGLYTGPR